MKTAQKDDLRRRVVVTGMGWVTPLGHTIDGVWQRLLAGESGVAPTSVFDASTFPTTFSAEVKGYDLSFDVADVAPYLDACRRSHFLLGACAQAWRASGLDQYSDLNRDRTGMYMAIGEGSLDFDAITTACLSAWDAPAGALDIPRWTTAALSNLDAIRELEQEPNIALSRLARLTGASGPALNSLTACAASAQSIGEAAQLLRRGDADVMIAGGTNSMIHPFGVTGFNRLTTLSMRNDDPASASRPFDATRDGFVIGEGAGVVVLETLEHAVDRRAPILAEVIGFGSTADAYRVTDQHPNSEGSIEAIRLAIADAGIAPAEVDYINAHGTGTRENDSHETFSIRAIFGDHAKKVPISSIKSMLGHLVTAAGVVEFIACVLAIRDQIIPPTTNLQNPDPDCDLDYVPRMARKARVNIAMSNNLGFGGQNDTLIVRRLMPDESDRSASLQDGREGV
jgi:3-oxoacyl-[acyl-carrier-protein] synthase II